MRVRQPGMEVKGEIRVLCWEGRGAYPLHCIYPQLQQSGKTSWRKQHLKWTLKVEKGSSQIEEEKTQAGEVMPETPWEDRKLGLFLGTHGTRCT